ncbi:ATPase, T2SS/T4P/T4SS family [Massilia sp. CF038]|uniref:ATPase, T2SS/T4P/T4SS family n=1 Tax=Massilia sp. CF038 TaxID=1881045 RepID=UPI0009132574|nr:ATPase, T2SS/T4P/T4SS family [Massilia sp. CF038]SHH24819.1 pilus assembly protein CpaF [Massilia sp. CF038]
MITIEAKRPDGQLAEYQISKTTVLGAESGSVIPLPSAVGKGALRLIVDEEGLTSVIDLASQTGVFVNGERIVRYGPLRADDAIMIGGQQLRVKSVAQARPVEPPRASMHAVPTSPAVPAPLPVPAASAPVKKPAPAPEPEHNTQLSEQTRNQQRALSRNAAVLHAELIQTLDLRRQDVTRMGDTELRVVASKLIAELMQKVTLPEQTDPAELAKFVLDEAVGLGVLESMLADDSVTEIMVNGAEDIFVERNGQTRRSDIAFSSEKAMMGVIERIVSPIGRRVDESSPLCDARLKDGSRVNIVIRPIALKGPSISIRKFAKRRLGVADLVKFDSVDDAMVDFLKTCVEQKKNIVISGGTGSGKTTLLNIISNLIPPYERIVTIEDAAELKLYHDNLVTLEARPANVEGRGSVTIRELVKNALRMRPDRIVVGECRGGEALDMLQAMNTGHDGSLTTAHANSPRDMLSRLEVMVMMGGMDLPIMAIREQVASAVQIIVQQTRFACGTRKVTSITEITGMERGVIQMQEIYRFQRLGFYENGKIRGQFVPCGNVPTFYEELRSYGVDLDLKVFGVNDDGERSGVKQVLNG